MKSTLLFGVGIWLVSDASKKHGHRAYAWVIANEASILCHNTGTVFAAFHSMTSYREEAFGVLSLVVFLRQLFSDTDSSCHFRLTIHCDNLGVVNKAGFLYLFDADADTNVFCSCSQSWMQFPNS